jgi:DNA-binding protein H-NS
MKIDLDALSLQELTSLLTAAEKRKRLLSSRRSAASVRRKVVALAAQHGYTIEELYGDRPSAEAAEAPGKKRAPRRKQAKVAPKYRDPDNKRNTWSGRGRMPRWLAHKTKHGRSVADFLIPGLAKPTARKNGTIGRRTLIKPD